ncbi:unnamed protein product, partial [Candidula unifasciata]
MSLQSAHVLWPLMSFLYVTSLSSMNRATKFSTSSQRQRVEISSSGRRRADMQTSTERYKMICHRRRTCPRN